MNVQLEICAFEEESGEAERIEMRDEESVTVSDVESGAMLTARSDEGPLGRDREREREEGTCERGLVSERE